MRGNVRAIKTLGSLVPLPSPQKLVVILGRNSPFDSGVDVERWSVKKALSAVSGKVVVRNVFTLGGICNLFKIETTCTESTQK